MPSISVKQVIAIAIFVLPFTYRAPAQNNRQANRVVMNLITASVLKAPEFNGNEISMHHASSYADKPAQIEYIDAEHAFYKAPLRKSTLYGSYIPNATSEDYYIVIEKSKYELSVFSKADDELLATYPIVLGNDDLKDKICEGDRETPEGEFKIISKKPHGQWNKYLGINYPTAESQEKYNARKAQGLVPAGAGIGGGIGLHGTRPHEDINIDRRENWTFGCVSTKNAYIDELYAYIPIGTKVIIKK